MDSLEILIDILVNPIPQKQHISVQEDFDLIVIDAIGTLGKKNCCHVLNKIEFMLEIKDLRYIVLWVIDEIFTLECLPYLELISKNDDLSEEEISQLILTLISLDKKKAFEIYEYINSRYSEKYPEALSKLNNELNK